MSFGEDLGDALKPKPHNVLLFVGSAFFIAHYSLYILADFIRMLGGWTMLHFLDFVVNCIGLAGMCFILNNSQKFHWYGSVLLCVAHSVGLFWIWRIVKVLGWGWFTLAHLFGVLLACGAAACLLATCKTLRHNKVHACTSVAFGVAGICFILADVALLKKYSFQFPLLCMLIGDISLVVGGSLWTAVCTTSINISAEQEPLLAEEPQAYTAAASPGYGPPSEAYASATSPGYGPPSGSSFPSQQPQAQAYVSTQSASSYVSGPPSLGYVGGQAYASGSMPAPPRGASPDFRSARQPSPQHMRAPSPSRTMPMDYSSAPQIRSRSPSPSHTMPRSGSASHSIVHT
mmetsp:Transcript_21409/g.50330  ORF Transcript_21409/g.50330 Transcript_21409/m.50330 type:complete len:345 (+) Transcript_21409:29-1063(+)